MPCTRATILPDLHPPGASAHLLPTPGELVLSYRARKRAVTGRGDERMPAARKQRIPPRCICHGC
jgi:hypothetical protein